MISAGVSPFARDKYGQLPLEIYPKSMEDASTTRKASSITRYLLQGIPIRVIDAIAPDTSSAVRTVLSAADVICVGLLLGPVVMTLYYLATRRVKVSIV